MTTHRRGAIVAAAAAALATASPALAGGDGFQGWGPRLGLSADPDQIRFGAHADFGQIARHVRFQPSLEMGLGDNLDIVSLNFDAAYRFQSRWDVWNPYLGGGLSMFFIGNDNRGAFNSNTEAGLSLLGGIERGLTSGNRFFIEGKLGFMDAPEFQATVGWTFPG